MIDQIRNSTRSRLVLTGLLAAVASVASVGVLFATADDTCAAVAEGSIRESTASVRYSDRLTRMAELPILNGLGANQAIPAESRFKPTSIDGRSRQHSATGERGSVTMYFLDRPLGSLTASELLAAGGIVLSQDPRIQHRTMADAAMARFPDRVITIKIGPHDGAVVWGDETRSGIRPHVVVWSDDSFEYRLDGDRSAAALVTVARSLACGTS